VSGAVETIEALVERAASGGWDVRAPRVGVFRGAPRAGARRTAGDAVGRLTCLAREEEIVLPAGVEGTVAAVAARDRTQPVEYGQLLFTLAPFAAGESPGHPGGLALPHDSVAPQGEPIPEGCFAVTCPIDGIFYRSPSPGSPPFVQPGDSVETGRTLALVEAMKSFNAVVYGAAGLPPRATVVQARAADGSEVRLGTVLFVLQPA
jgi:acetyl-CoA carboxylase biotin carboxyl carrier protein